MPPSVSLNTLLIDFATGKRLFVDTTARTILRVSSHALRAAELFKTVTPPQGISAAELARAQRILTPSRDDCLPLLPVGQARLQPYIDAFLQQHAHNDKNQLLQKLLQKRHPLFFHEDAFLNVIAITTLQPTWFQFIETALAEPIVTHCARWGIWLEKSSGLPRAGVGVA